MSEADHGLANDFDARHPSVANVDVHRAARASNPEKVDCTGARNANRAPRVPVTALVGPLPGILKQSRPRRTPCLGYPRPGVVPKGPPATRASKWPASMLKVSESNTNSVRVAQVARRASLPGCLRSGDRRGNGGGYPERRIRNCAGQTVQRAEKRIQRQRVRRDIEVAFMPCQARQLPLDLKRGSAHPGGEAGHIQAVAHQRRLEVYRNLSVPARTFTFRNRMERMETIVNGASASGRALEAGAWTVAIPAAREPSGSPPVSWTSASSTRREKISDHPVTIDLIHSRALGITDLDIPQVEADSWKHGRMGATDSNRRAEGCGRLALNGRSHGVRAQPQSRSTLATTTSNNKRMAPVRSALSIGRELC